MSQIGKPYVWAGAGPDSYDCSGLTMWAFAHVGISLPHSAAGQYGYGTHVPVSQLQPGDLVFFADGGYIGHVGIYYGNGEMVDAPHSGSTVGIHALYGGLVGGTRL
jgi:cell wall-associated NlpC family hydrolase